MRTVLNSRTFIWLLLALPAAMIFRALVLGDADANDLVHPSGETAARLMVLAMAIGPLADIAGRGPWTLWLLARRRWIGFAAFAYALLHLAFYIDDMGALDDILAEFGETGIWTGWAALLCMAGPGLTSFNRAMGRLRRNWKRVQRAAYPAAVLTVVHWGILELRWGPALLHFGPLAALNLARVVKHKRIKRKGTYA